MDPRARAYVARRQAEGRSHREATRALKRHLSDVIYRQLVRDASNATPNSGAQTQIHARRDTNLT